MDIYTYSGEGYLPLVMTEDWQVAQLNYTVEQSVEQLTMLDQHDFTDETFTLLKGNAVLIAYDEKTRGFEFAAMIPEHTYNIPKMTWHNIAMQPDCCVLITEGRDAHLKGCNHMPMPKDLKERLSSYTARLWAQK